MAIRESSGRRSGPRSAVAIEVGLNVVHAVEVAFGGERVRLLRRGSAPVASPWDDLGASRDALAAAIRAAMAAAGIQSREVIACLPRRLVTLKYARLPHGSADEIAGMVRFEAQQYVPFPIDEVVLDHRIVSDESDELTTVLIVAARKPLVDPFLAAFDRADLEVKRLSVSSLALAEHLRAGAVPAAILSVEPGEMDMAVVATGRVLFSRSALLPATDAGLDLQALAAEVARSLAAYQNEYRALPVSQLLVVGTSKLVPEVEQTLQRQIETPAKRLTNELLPAPDPEAIEYATAAGLALQLDPSAIAAVNLVPPEREQRKVVARRRTQSMLAAVVAFVLLGFACTLLARSMQAQQKERLAAQRANEKLKAVEARLKTTKSEYDRVAANHRAVTLGLWRSKPAVDVVKAVSDSIPARSGTYLTQLQYERTGNVILHGSAKSEIAATDFVLALQRTGAFADVRLGYIGDAQSEGNGAQLSAVGLGASRLKVPDRMNYIINCRMAGPPVAPTRSGPKPTAAGKQVASAAGTTGGDRP